MPYTRPLRVALFTHSTQPRGGVVYALDLAEALTDLGHDVTVHAPDATGKGFFRDVRCHVRLVPTPPGSGSVADVHRTRIAAYIDFLEQHAPEFDVYHAQDGISANALAVLVARGVIPSFLRTVHHLDDLDDSYLVACQDRSVVSAGRCLCVSKLWQRKLMQTYGVDAAVVPSGVSAARFAATRSPEDEMWRARLGLGAGPVFLALGGVEPRKNTVKTLEAFLAVRAEFPHAQLLIAGGASLLDHSAYRQQFEQVLAGADEQTRRSVILAGTLPDGAMPSVFRLADALVFPSAKEGFGLAVLEAMACGTPVIAPAAPPFIEYLDRSDAILVDPQDAGAIAGAMTWVTDAAVYDHLRAAGLALSSRFSWDASAKAHLTHYRELHEPSRTPVPVLS
ncbi:MAG: MSMEG_0565 family glycosyltransferase [Phycisphaerae bacterium]|nr:MSMEG_0565 family glycosyltransferase [Tepidisphaeraceae bacterium]